MACIEVLAGAAPPPIAESSAAARGVINQIVDFHRRYWAV